MRETRRGESINTHANISKILADESGWKLKPSISISQS